MNKENIVVCIIILSCIFAFASSIALVVIESKYGAGRLAGGNNSNTYPNFPVPGDDIKIYIDNEPEKTFKVFPIAEETSTKIPVIWWEDISIDPGSKEYISNHLVMYKVNPLTREKLSGPYAVTVDGKKAYFEFKLKDNLADYIDFQTKYFKIKIQSSDEQQQEIISLKIFRQFPIFNNIMFYVIRGLCGISIISWIIGGIYLWGKAGGI